MRGTKNTVARNTSTTVRVERLPLVIRHLDVVVVLALCWLAQDSLVAFLKPLATFIVQEAGDPFEWLEPIPVATDLPNLPVQPPGIEV